MIKRWIKIISKKNKTLIEIDNIDANKTLVSKWASYDNKTSFKYFIGYNNNDEVIPLCIKLAQMMEYAKCFDSNKTMSFKVTDQKVLKSYIKICKKLAV